MLTIHKEKIQRRRFATMTERIAHSKPYSFAIEPPIVKMDNPVEVAWMEARIQKFWVRSSTWSVMT